MGSQIENQNRKSKGESNRKTKQKSNQKTNGHFKQKSNRKSYRIQIEKHIGDQIEGQIEKSRGEVKWKSNRKPKTEKAFGKSNRTLEQESKQNQHRKVDRIPNR